MSLPNYLAKIKSAGIYRFVWDKSIAPIQAADTLRLVVGYSEKGPFNTPTYIQSASEFIQIYGNIIASGHTTEQSHNAEQMQQILFYIRYHIIKEL